jgi:hypothetical protein
MWPIRRGDGQAPDRANTDSQVSAANYSRRLLIQVGRQTFRFGWGQVMLLSIAIMTVILAVSGTIQTTDFHTNVRDTLWPFLIFLAAYILVQMVRAQLALDRQRAEQIDTLNKQLGETVSVWFEKTTFRHPTPDSENVTMVVHMSVRTAGSPVTLYGWALRSQLRPKLKPVPINVLGLGQPVGGLTIRLDEHDHASGSVFFDFSGVAQVSEDELRDPDHSWRLEFWDAHGPYSEHIPEQLYKRP